MRVSLEPRDLTHYPFLKESQEFLAGRGINVVHLTESVLGRKYLDLATERVVTAIDGKEVFPEQVKDPVADIATYILARMLVSCLKDRGITDRLCRMEAKRIYQFIHSEENPGLKTYVCTELGIDLGVGSLPVLRYVELASGVREAKWRLVNREVTAGSVAVSDDELDKLLQERIRAVLSAPLPLAIPPKLEHGFASWCDIITAAMQNRTLAEFGAIDESAYPPCVQALIAGAAAGANLSHSGRFAMTAFLTNIGMTPAQIGSIFARSPDFNADMTMYQVDHIATHEYITPSCPTMLTHGICVNKDKLCEKVGHPLNYYRSKKRELERKRKREELQAAAAAAVAAAEKPEQTE